MGIESADRLIVYSKLEKVINDIEDAMQKHELDIEERQLTLKFVNQRIGDKVRTQKSKDMMGSLDMSDLMGNFKRAMGGGNDS